MPELQTAQEVGVDEVQRKLADALGPRFRVTVTSRSTLRVGRTGVIPSDVTLTHSQGGTTFSVRTTGLIVSRVVQATSINPQVKRALAEAYPAKTPA